MFRNIFSKASDVVKKAADHFRKIVLFTCVIVFILFHVQQYKIDLKVIGDAAINLGPIYVVDNATLLSFHHGDKMFGGTAGIQCVCKSLYVLYWSKTKKVFVWNGSDLDHILVRDNFL